MTPGARIAAASGVLDAVLAGDPAERALLGWSRGARYAGAKDRAAVRDLVFDALRRRRSLAWAGGSETGRGLMLGALRLDGRDPSALLTGLGYDLAPPGPGDEGRPLDAAPEAVRLDVPDWLLAHLRASLGDDLDRTCEALRARAPVHLRANLAKATRDEAAEALAAEGISSEPVPGVATALAVTANASLVARSRAFFDGLVELQDASSQAAVLALPLAENDQVLDLCAGGGGKSLAMAARATLRLDAHDADPRRMADLPARAARAGAKIRVVATPRGPYDLVLIDAPCSGSGTWRRTPDAKWRLTEARLSELTAIQAGLIEQAAALVHPGGRIAFATCSVLADEGPDQVEAAMARHPGWREEGRFVARPGPGGDGFYQAVLAT